MVQDQKSDGSAGGQQRVSAPSISLPKGGAAIRGIGEKFAANPVTGTGSLTVPITTSPGRSGFGPQLALAYDSGSGNGPFGFGWSLALPSITRKTDKGLPQYLDVQESDVFILSGAEDLVPVYRQDAAGTWVRDPQGNLVVHQDELDGYSVRRYRPRIEGLFARIERWTRNGDVHWRSISQDNILTLYGKDADSRIADPEDPRRIFRWLICETRDDKGNAVLYDYKPEDGAGVDLTRTHERNRGDRNAPQRTANRYLKGIRYGNHTPLLSNAGQRPRFLTAAQLLTAGWMFEVVFDYGEHDAKAPKPRDTGQWTYRDDPFSSYRAGFEVRTTRLCQRVLMFHHFASEPGIGNDCLVRSTDFTYSHEQNPANTRNPVYTFLRAVTQTGYRRTNGGYTKRSLPPVEFEYTQPIVQDTVEEVDPASLENLPIGVDGLAYQWTDLHGEGIPGILTEQAGTWFYKRNLSPSSERPVEFAPLEHIAAKPNLALAGGQAQFMDLAGDGQPDLVVLDGPMPGLYEHDGAEGWQPFRPFTARLNRDTHDPNLKFVDLDGDGHTDVLISEDDAFVWHASLAEQGFGPARRVQQALDEEKGPRLVFADGTQSIYLADLSGDGLTDLVRIRNGAVCYWPNLGYGRFGAKVTMDNAPYFDHPDQFDHQRLRLADIDGTGTTDIIYLHRDGVRLYFNQSGNSWGAPQPLRVFPRVDDLVAVAPADLRGTGTACLVWSSPLPGDVQRPMRYVDLMGGQKPHLLVKTVNNLGAETVVQYAPSTRFYLQDKRDGKPWITRLPFPVHVVERVETFDAISGNRFVTRYAYHHGSFDGEEREFRGFGMVEQFDTEAFAALTADGTLPAATNLDAASHVPPVLTKTWFHTGVYLERNQISTQLAKEYYGAPAPGDPDYTNEFELFIEAELLPDTVLPAGLVFEEEREACRALKGVMLRQEVYALDGTEKASRPYTVTEQNFTIRLLQPKADNRYGVFFTHAREAVSYHYERNPTDPRVGHALTLEVDGFGNVLKSAAVGYGRRQLDLALLEDDRAKQAGVLVTYTENGVTNPIDDPDLYPDDYRTPLPCETRTYELTGYLPTGAAGRFQSADFVQSDPSDPHGLQLIRIFDSELPYEEAPTHGTQRRLIEQVRTLYRSNDLTGLLPFNSAHADSLQSMAVPGESYKLAFTPELLNTTYQRGTETLLPDAQSVLGLEGGYRRSDEFKSAGLFPDADPAGLWWIPSGRVFYSTNEADPPAQEWTEATAHFFVPRRYRDPFGNATIVDYDGPTDPTLPRYDLLVTRTQEPVQNVVRAENDYRVLQPKLITDPNGNRSEVAFDTLGMVAGTAMKGKDNTVGDTFRGFAPDLTQAQVDGFYAGADPHVPAPGLLQGATTRIIYDLDRFHRTQQAHPADPAQWLPAYAATLARETHGSDPLPPQGLKIQIGFSYSDGFGREIQKKIQAEPGPLGEGGPVVSPRWVGSGWTIFNNKGKPVRQYEPFFSATHGFEFGVQVGVSPILFYDPVGRVVATLHPNHTYEKAVFDPWRQTTYDVNDTVAAHGVETGDPRTDADIQGYVAAYFKTQPNTWQTWHQQRISGAQGAQEQHAAQKAAQHANTPTTAHFDTLGRPFLTLAHNGFDPDGTPIQFPTRVELDIEGNQRVVRDAIVQNNDPLGRIVMRYDYDMLGGPIHSASMEAGECWMLNDVAGKPLYGWDSRDHRLRTVYDVLRRPTEVYLQEDSAPELLVGKTVYGESQPNPEASNLRGKPYQAFDGAGVVTTGAYDFKGNALTGSRQLTIDYKTTPDWSEAVALEAELFTTSTSFDALNRPVTQTTPDNSTIRPAYNEANLLEAIDANLRGEMAAGQLVWKPFVTDIDYNAKGQRELIRYGNGVETTYDYDQLTFRLINLKTSRSADGDLQDLSYTYDPSGNITYIKDAAQQTIFFANTKVTPDADYTYDAINQLIKATGREHIGQVGQVDHNDPPIHPLPHPNNVEAMRPYTEVYKYDAVGNIMAMIHQAGNGSWTRQYQYAADSNRLLATSMPGDDPNGPYTGMYQYDLHGSMTRMPHLPTIAWDFAEHMQASSTQVVNDGTPETTYYVYDASGQRVRKVTERQASVNQMPTRTKERIYLGGFEVYREYSANGDDVALERETLHIMDDKQRIALVETKTFDITSPLTTHPSLIRYQLSNHLGSASLELDETGQVISYEEYHPYGSTSYQAVDSDLSAEAKRYRYTGKERDEETGFSYHGARYYAPWLGRWITPDPAGLIDGNNLYAYARNNPIVFHDPTGTTTHSDVPENIRPPDDKPLEIGNNLFVKLEEGVFQGQYTGTGGSDAWLPADSPEKIQWWSDVAGREDATAWIAGYMTLVVGGFGAAEFGGLEGIKWLAEEGFSEATGIPVSPRDLLDATYAIRDLGPAGISAAFNVIYAGKRELLNAFSFAEDFMSDETRAWEALQAFDVAVMEVGKGQEMWLHDAVERVLRDMETKHGFGGTLTLEDRFYNPVEFARELSKGLAINDPKFKKDSHGELGHRIQMWALGYELDKNPGAFGRVTVAELQAAIGNAGVWLENNKIWVQTFDETNYDVPNSPNWWGEKSIVLEEFWKGQ